MKHELDKPTFQPVSSFDQLARSAGGRQPAPGANTPTPISERTDLSVPAVAAGYDQLRSLGGASLSTAGTPAPSSIPQTSQPDLSQQSFAPINTMPNVISGK